MNVQKTTGTSTVTPLARQAAQPPKAATGHAKPVSMATRDVLTQDIPLEGKALQIQRKIDKNLFAQVWEGVGTGLGLCGGVTGLITGKKAYLAGFALAGIGLYAVVKTGAVNKELVKQRDAAIGIVKTQP